MIRVLAIGAVASAVPAGLGAQATPPADSLPAYLLDEVTVEARRTPTRPSDVPQQVEVVTRRDLDRTHGSNLAEALKRNAPVDVIQFPALLAGVSVRGFRPQYSGLNPRTLILIDGRPAGATNLATLDVGSVERIEVLKGPASALYGSSAMGGAINVVTRSSQGPLEGRVETSYGSFGSYRGELATGGSLGARVDFDLALAAAGRRSGFETGGARLFGGETVTKYLADGTTTRLPETIRDTVLQHSRFGTRSGNLRVGYEIADDWRMEARIGAFRGDDIENPGDLNVSAYSTQTVNDLERTTGDLALSGRAGAHALLIRGFTAREVTSYYDSAENPTYISSRSPNRWHGAQIQDVVSFGRHRLTAGIDYTSSEAGSEVYSAPGTPTSPYNPDAAIRSLAAFSEAKIDVLGDERLLATFGGRLDRVAFEVRDATLADGSTVEGNVENHAVFNPSGGLVYQPRHGVRLHASAGRAFVTPGAFSVAGYSERPAGPNAVTVTRGNPALDPETSTSWDVGAGLRRVAAGVDADLTYFSTRVEGRVAAVPVPVEEVRLTAAGDTIKATTTFANADEGRIRGLELTLGYDLGALSGYDYSLRLFTTGTRMLSARETTGGITTDVRNVADLTVIAGVDYDDLDRLGVRLTGRYVGERLDTDWTDFMNPGDVRYPEFLVLDLSGSLRLSDRYRLTARIANLTDENYYEVRGYTMPGREMRVGFGITW